MHPFGLVAYKGRRAGLSALCCRGGIELASVDVRFKNLNVESWVYAGSRALPTVLNSYRNVVDVSSPRNSICTEKCLA